MEYRVEHQPDERKGATYRGYIDNEYAGYVSGHERYKGVFYIERSALLPCFQGTKAVRALSEIIKGVHKNYDTIMSRISNKDNGPIKILLSTGFHIIGTVQYKGDLVVELLKKREMANG